MKRLELFPDLHFRPIEVFTWYTITGEPVDSEKFKSGLTKIAQAEECKSQKHNPPSHLVVEPGVYVWKCEDCGEAFEFVVPEIFANR